MSRAKDWMSYWVSHGHAHTTTYTLLLYTAIFGTNIYKASHKPVCLLPLLLMMVALNLDKRRPGFRLGKCVVGFFIVFPSPGPLPSSLFFAPHQPPLQTQTSLKLCSSPNYTGFVSPDLVCGEGNQERETEGETELREKMKGEDDEKANAKNKNKKTA